MAERPILKLPKPESIDPKKVTGRGAQVQRPNKARQQSRLGPKFERLEGIAANPQALLELRADPASIAPERAIVFEVEGSLKDFYQQAADLGMDYLGDFEQDFEATEDFYYGKRPQQVLGGRIYLAMPDVRALEELLSRWKTFQERKIMPRGQGDWGALFRQLVDVRAWGPQDRIDPLDREEFEAELAANPGQPVNVEVELWFFDQEAKRQAAEARVLQLVQQTGGNVQDRSAIPEIRYHALVVELPAAAVQQLVDSEDVLLARSDDIMFLRPQSVLQDLQDEQAPQDSTAPPVAVDFGGRQPIAALLDGLPIQNHRHLAGRLIIDDPDNLDPTYLVRHRRHGTEMSSLICHGDLNEAGNAIGRPLYVRPILQVDQNGVERSAKQRLLVDTVYRAVRRIKAGEAGQPPVAPSVVVINFSIGDEARPFARAISPLARLLDYLAHTYNVLFLVSTGNISTVLPIPAYQNTLEFEGATPADREKAVFDALNASKGHRTLLSPAEAMNVLTIGAANRAAVFNGNLPANQYDVFTSEDGPNVTSAMGLGFKKTVKPELLFDGGRMPLMFQASGAELVLRAASGGTDRYGLKVASATPGGGTAGEIHICGSSAGTALATRASHVIYDGLMDRDGGSLHADMEASYTPLALKALLVHSARWGQHGQILDEYFPPQGTGSHPERRDDITRLLGYGTINVQQVVDCAENCATMLGYGEIKPGAGLLYRIPLPDDLEGNTAFRSFTATLAWFTPINSRHQGYRRAALDISPGNETEKYWLVNSRHPYQPTDKAVARGTVFHEMRTSEEARVFVDDGHLMLRVSCRATAGEFTDPVPFAIAVSLEVGATAGIEVYEKVLVALGAQIRAGVAAA